MRRKVVLIFSCNRFRSFPFRVSTVFVYLSDVEIKIKPILLLLLSVLIHGSCRFVRLLFIAFIFFIFFTFVSSAVMEK